MSVELRAARGDRWQPHGLVHRARSRVRLRPNRIRELILVDEWRAGWHANLEGINRYAAKLAEGSTRSYWYAWKGGPRLQGEPGPPEFTASYNEAVAQKIKTPAGRLLWFLHSY
jgi:hypothetical protein